MSASTHLPALAPLELLDGRSEASPTTPRTAPVLPVARAVPSFDDVYRAELAFVWRSARRLGVRESALDDVVQEVFVVVHRRLSTFEARSSLRTWLFGITLRIVRDHLRSTRRKATSDDDVDTFQADVPGPGELAERSEAVRLLHAILDELDDEKREVFVMAELEQMTMPEIAEVISVNLNTAYARLRLARQAFESALARYRARDGWRLR